jgi:tRNA-splicing ligase RtcB
LTSEIWQGSLEKIDDYRWRIPKSYKSGMRVPGIIYADEKLLKDIRHDKALEQVANVAFLPGIVNASLAMPDIHWGYGFCIGGVAATDIEQGGVISPAGVGYDINCGVRMLKTDFQYEEIKDKIKDLVYALFSDVPAGLGSKGQIRVSAREEKEILVKGAKWAVQKGYGTDEDLECTEEYGAIQGADPEAVSDRAYERGKAQSGTLGSGNHFLEIQVIDQLYDRDICDEFGLTLGQITIMIHSGSRGLGYQVCDDYVKDMVHCLQKYSINVPDRQLGCAPVNSPEGKAYLGAMKCAANYAWANRQCLMYLTREVFARVFGMPWEKMGMYLIYDVAHNIAKIEKHVVDGKEKTLCVHRKGATRAFPAGHPALPERYKKTGQPVIIPGDMGRNSYLLVGTQKAMEETFGSTCHGAGRLKSRTAASRSIDERALLKELESKGIIVKASGRGTIAEEAPQAYKDVNEVVDVVHNAGISKRVCRMRPLGVIKG